MKDYTDRIEGFQIRDIAYFGKPPIDAPIRFDIVKWVQEKNPHIGTVCRLTDSGNWTAKEELITEFCYSVGTLEWDSCETCFDFKSVGLRWLEAKPSNAVVDMILDFCKRKEKEIDD